MKAFGKYTPGPWRGGVVDEGRNIAHVWTDREYPRGECVAEVRGNWSDQLLPTVNLIAAAPDLLAALKNLVADFDQSVQTTDPMLVEARAAIDKAEGTP